MKVFVTGGAGFIGSHLCRQLIESGHEITAYDNLLLGRREFIADLERHHKFKFLQKDLLDDKNLRQALQGADLVYHLAANSDISLGGEKTDLDLKLGVMATYNLLEAMRLEKITNLIFSSTSAIYGEAHTKPTPENYGPLIPISFYGASKLSAEVLIAAFAHNYGIQSWIYRFANIVGSRITHGVLFDFIKRLRQNPQQLSVLGNGTQKKSYLHVSDCIAGMQFGFEKAKSEVNIFNLASEGVTQVSYIAQEVIQQMELNAKIEYGKEDRGWKGDVPFTWLDGSKLKKLGWSPKYNSNQAVQKAITEILKGREF